MCQKYTLAVIIVFIQINNAFLKQLQNKYTLGQVLQL